MLTCELLRTLTVQPGDHPQGSGRISAASGLVCAHGRAYVIADDDLHLAVFDDTQTPGRLHAVLPGALPLKHKARKRAKPDFEALLRLPPGLIDGCDALIALGSGSLEQRQRGVAIVLDSDGEPVGQPQVFDLTPMHTPLRELLGEINLEGAIVQGDALLMFNRGVAGRSDNAVVCYALRDLIDLIGGATASITPIALRRYRLGDIDGVPLGFTDAAALPDGGCLFSAVAEATDSSCADGEFRGAVIGRANARGGLQWLRRLRPNVKVEGIDVQVQVQLQLQTGNQRECTRVCLVTDPDDAAQSAQMLLTSW